MIQMTQTSNSADTASPEYQGPRILITGGGTGGHVYPGLAVAEALQRLVPGVDLRFAGTSSGIESVLVPQAGHRLVKVPASGVRGLGGKARFFFLLNFLMGFLRSFGWLLTWRPAVVLGTGGYVIGPVMTAARVLGIRCLLQEQNSVPGSANRLVGRWAQQIYLGFGSAAKYFKSGRTQETGNPVRSSFAADVAGEISVPPIAHDETVQAKILVFGGSGGARTLNRALAGAADRWMAKTDCQLVIQTGPHDLEDTRQAFGGAAANRIRIEPYYREMAAALRWADLVVCRAGAMTLAELQAVGRPAILVPYPHATDNHQLSNARDCEAAGAAVVLKDDECTPETMYEAVEQLLADPARLEEMGRAARAMSRPDAAEKIARDLLSRIGHSV